MSLMIVLSWSAAALAIVTLNWWIFRSKREMSAEENKAINDNADYELQQW